jgi:hypothetical protein
MRSTPFPRLRRALRTAGRALGAPTRPGAARPAALHATSLIVFNVIPATLVLALGLAVLLLVLDGLGWRIVAAMFDRERLITGTR